MTDGTDAATPAPVETLDTISILKKAFIRLSMPIFPLYTVFDGKCTCGDPGCKDQGKHPIVEWTKERTTNTGKIHDWIEKYGRCNWGGTTGKLSGVFVVDIDPRHGGDKTFTDLEVQYGKIPDTRIHRTGGGGVHIIFSIPRGVTIKSGSNVLGPGVDVKGEDGYIVLPPSRHISGGVYEVLNDVPAADPPEWLINLLQNGESTAGICGPGFKMPDTIPAGARTTTLFKAASSLRAKGFSEQAVDAAIRIENQLRCEHPPVPDQKLQGIIRDASRNYPAAGTIIHTGTADVADLVKLTVFKKDASGRPRTDDNGIPMVDRVTLDNQKMALYLVDTLHTISTGGDIWVYRNGMYSQDEGQIHTLITSVCRELGMQNQTGHCLQVESMLKGTNFYAESPFNYKMGVLPLRNGYIVINFDTGTVTGPFPHTPENLFTFCLPVDYNPDAPTDPVLKVFNEWVNPEDVDILAQIPAQGFLQAWLDAPYKKAYILQGEQHGGKSSYLELLYRAFGKSNGTLSDVALHSMVTNRFATAGLENTLLNIHDDLSDDELYGFTTFKNLTGSTRHEIERKGQQPRNARIFCVHVFACNIPPMVPERAKYDVAFWGRWEYLVFPNVFEIDPTWYDRTFTDEFLSGFLNLVIKKVIEIYRTGKLVINHDVEQVMERWYQNSDPLYQFFDEMTTTEDVNGKTITKFYKFDKKKLFEFYNDYFTEHNFDERKRIKSVEKFTREIQKFGFIPSRERITTGTGKEKRSGLVRCYIANRLWCEGTTQVEPKLDDELSE